MFLFLLPQKTAIGKELFDKVCNYLTLQEKEYFGLQYVNNNVKVGITCTLKQDKVKNSLGLLVYTSSYHDIYNLMLDLI